jgi:F-type H+-transporting ATPase subunit delta
MAIVSSRYSQAIFDSLSSESPELAEAGLDQLRSFAEVLESQPTARQILVNPVIPSDQRERFIGQVAKVLSLDARVRKLIVLLADRRRLDLLDEVIDAYREMLDEHKGIVRAVVTSAAALSDSQQKKINAKLERSIGKRVVMDVHQDPALLGGVVVQIGGTVYDGSVLQHLAGFRSRLGASG